MCWPSALFMFLGGASDNVQKYNYQGLKYIFNKIPCTSTSKAPKIREIQAKYKLCYLFLLVAPLLSHR